MASPKTDAFYFPHDYNSIQDPKMMVLLLECGVAGIGLYWILIEILHQQETGSMSADELRDYIKFYTKFETNVEHLLNKIQQVLISSGLLFLKDGQVCSNRVLRNKEYRSDISEKRSLAGRKSAESRIKPTSVEQVLTSVEQNPTKERKGKEIKGKKEKIDIYNKIFDFECLWSRYPNKDGKRDAERHFRATVKTEEDFNDIKNALNNYLSSERVKNNFVKNGSTWFNNWRDWITYEDPKSAEDEQKEILRKAGLLNDSNSHTSRRREYHEG